MATYKKWTVEEIDFIKNNYNVVSDMELAVKLSEMLNQQITTSMIRRQRRKLEIIKPRGRPKKVENTQVTPSAE
jgi:hypothetical protein